MKLTAENLEKVILECLFKPNEDTTNYVLGEGVRVKMGFHPERLKANEGNILSMLKDLPDEFLASKGGGYTFLNACMTRDNDQWGEQQDVDKLITIGMAVKKVSFTMPREMWDVLPGGMPYFTVKDN